MKNKKLIALTLGLISVISVSGMTVAFGSGNAPAAKNYIDENNDGICDNRESCLARFLDKDNDGICDNKNSSECPNANSSACGRQGAGTQNGCARRQAENGSDSFIDEDKDGICDNKNSSECPNANSSACGRQMRGRGCGRQMRNR